MRLIYKACSSRERSFRGVGEIREIAASIGPRRGCGKMPVAIMEQQ
jgi:hypothetical protein